MEAFLASHKKHFTLAQAGRDIMLAKAETKERRQKKLEQVCSSCTFPSIPFPSSWDNAGSEHEVKVSKALPFSPQFFREAYALTFGLRPGERRRRSDDSDTGEVVTVMRTSLSKSEFASALGMRADAVFVKKMFNIVDKDRDGRISFQVGTCFPFSNYSRTRKLLRAQIHLYGAGVPGHRIAVFTREDRGQAEDHLRHVRQGQQRSHR